MARPQQISSPPFEPSLLYTLTLASGTSLELVANCETFLRALLAQLHLSYGAIWLKSHYLTQGHQPSGFVLAHAVPEFFIRESQIGPTHPLIDQTNGHPFTTISSADPLFEACITEAHISRGSFLLARLGEFGFLKLYTEDVPPLVDPDLFLSLKRVLLHFEASVERCLAYQYLLDELGERERKEQRLARMIAQLSTVLGSLDVPLLVEDDTHQIVLTNQAFCDFFDLSTPPDALLGLARTPLFHQLQSHFANPDAALHRLNDLFSAPLPSAMPFVLSDGRTLEISCSPLVMDSFSGHLWQFNDRTPVPALTATPVALEHPKAQATTRFDLRDLFHTVSAKPKQQAEAKGLLFQQFVHDHVPHTLRGDVHNLEQILTLLLHNALRHTTQGHIILTCVPIQQTERGVMLQFAIADTGCGIPQAHLPTLFEEAHALAHAQQWVQNQKGQLSVQSVAGRGSVFTLVLTFGQPTPQPTATSPEP